jgi:hypothetical protein
MIPADLLYMTSKKYLKLLIHNSVVAETGGYWNKVRHSLDSLPKSTYFSPKDLVMFIINGAEDDRLGKLEDCEIYAA